MESIASSGISSWQFYQPEVLRKGQSVVNGEEEVNSNSAGSIMESAQNVVREV